MQIYSYSKVNNLKNRQTNPNFKAGWGNAKMLDDLIESANDKELAQILKMGYPSLYIVNFVQSGLKSVEQAKKLLDLRLAGYHKREALSSYNRRVSNDDLERLFLESPNKVLNTLKILGEKSFIASFHDKYENVKKYIGVIGSIDSKHPMYQKLIELTNPTESLKYKNTQAKITDLKKQFQTTENKTTLVKEINDLTDENKNLVKKSFTDYPEKIELAEFFYSMRDSKNTLESVLETYSKQNKESLQNLLNDVAREDPNKVICKQIDFTNNKYLPKLFVTDMGFRRNYNKMLSILNEKTNDSVEQVLLALPQNKETKTQFEKLGVNFDRWAGFDPKSKVEKLVAGTYRQQDVIRNLEDTLNSPIFALIADEKKEKLYKTMSANGYKLKSASFMPSIMVISDEIIRVKKLFKGKQLLSFDDLPQLVEILTDFMKNDSLWNKPDGDMQASFARKSLERFVKEIQPKMILAKKEPVSKSGVVTVQQVDMNNIAHSLFLGNDASCCMAVGSGFKQELAPNYVMNKMLSAIEVLVDGKSVGNTMCYIAEIEGKPALILDNIEIKPDYRNSTLNDTMRDLIFSYARKFVKELGVEDMPIFLGFNRNKVNLFGHTASYEDIKVVGSSGEDILYLDSIVKEGKFDGKKELGTMLYQISDKTLQNTNVGKKAPVIVNDV